jgi:prevent-host-death family protein
MAMVASRKLRNNTRSLITRAKSGETIIITVDGEPVAELRPVDHRRRWISRDEVFANFVQADPELRSELRLPGDSIAAHEERESNRLATRAKRARLA